MTWPYGVLYASMISKKKHISGHVEVSRDYSSQAFTLLLIRLSSSLGLVLIQEIALDLEVSGSWPSILDKISDFDHKFFCIAVLERMVVLLASL